MEPCFTQLADLGRSDFLRLLAPIGGWARRRARPGNFTPRDPVSFRVLGSYSPLPKNGDGGLKVAPVGIWGSPLTETVRSALAPTRRIQRSAATLPARNSTSVARNVADPFASS